MSNVRTESIGDRAAELFRTLGWPSVEQEAWRRTDLNRLLPKGALDAAADWNAPESAGDAVRDSAMLPEGWAARVVLENGRLQAVHLDEKAAEAGLGIRWNPVEGVYEETASYAANELEMSGDRLAAWHWRDLEGVLEIRLEKNSVSPGPVVIEERLTGTASHPHVDVRIEQGAELLIIWSFEGLPQSEGTAVVNAGLNARAAANADLKLVVRQHVGEGTAFFLNQNLVAGRDARVSLVESQLGGSVVKTLARAVMDEPGSDIRLKGLFLADDSRHMDVGTLQAHKAPQAFSDALYKGVVRPGGRSVFQGLIEVSPKASRTDSYLTNKNLVLGRGGRADSIPQLNILTDDVKCSHGSTTGKLDSEQMFYLTSRGFSPAEAEEELIRAFLTEVLDGLSDAAAEIITADLDARL